MAPPLPYPTEGKDARDQMLTPTLGLCITSTFDSGNIKVLDLSDPTNIRLAMEPEVYCETDKRAHMQWFHYRVSNTRGQALTMHIVNASEASYAEAYEGYQACASYDLQHWFRVPTTYEAGGALTLRHTPTFPSVHYAYFAPYSHDAHMKLVHATAVKAGVTLHVLGQTLDGRDMDCLQIGTHGPGKRVVWVVARQHPGETMAEHFMEGLLGRLTDPHDAVARHFLQGAVVYAVPNMNPDGAFRGHLRTNACGTNLNREWAAPSAAESPEVLVVLRKMDETGVDFLLDVHGDEGLARVFLIDNECIPGWNERLANLHAQFAKAFLKISPEFQTAKGYAPGEGPAKGELRPCSMQVGQRFDCLAMTLEMPFKDSDDLPEPIQGWSPERSRKLGAEVLGAVRRVLPILREGVAA